MRLSGLLGNSIVHIHAPVNGFSSRVCTFVFLHIFGGVTAIFFDQFTHLCGLHNTTPTAVTVKLGISKGAISQWKKGSCPTGEILVKFADYFDTSTDFLLGRNPDISHLAEELATDEHKLLLNYRSLTPQGKEQVRLNMTMALNTFKKSVNLSDMEAAEQIASDAV